MSEFITPTSEHSEPETYLGDKTISYVWPSRMPYVAYAGGSEVYTVGQLDALRRRGMSARIIAYTQMVSDSFEKYPEIPLLSLGNEQELADVDDTLIFMTRPPTMKTKNPSFLYLHTPIESPAYDHTPAFADNAISRTTPLTTSKFMAKYWRDTLDLPTEPAVIYPYADDAFAAVNRPERTTAKPRVLFAGRPTQEKGVFTLMASMYMPPLRKKEFDLTCVKTINHNGGADEINAMYDAHPRINAVAARPDRPSMARLYAENDIVVMPTSSVIWKEAFGMISVEAQHSGCRVVASNDGGLPETDCGGLLLVEPDNPLSLAEGIADAIALGPLSEAERKAASQKFTEKQSIDTLLRVLNN